MKPRHENQKDAERNPDGSFKPVAWEKKQEVLDRIASGERLKDICAAIDRSKAVVRSWFERDDDAMALYITAKRKSAMKWFDEIFEIADNSKIDARQKKYMLNVRMWALERFENDIIKLENRYGTPGVSLNAPAGTQLVVQFAEPVKTEEQIKEIEDAEVTDV